ncbi:MAG: hypothetical protein WBD22_00575, partial [Pyrinomonadaceae bacterium]
MPIKSFPINNLATTIGLAAVVVASLVGAYFFAKWGFAQSASERVEDPGVAELLTNIAPDDPQTHYAAGVLLGKTFLPGDLERSLRHFEKATALSPNNYLLWLELGRVRGAVGDVEGAE